MFQLNDGAYGTFDGTSLVISQATNNEVTLPTTVYYLGTDYTLDLANVQIQTAQIDTVDASNTNATIAGMQAVVEDAYNNNANQIITVHNGSIYVKHAEVGTNSGYETTVAYLYDPSNNWSASGTFTADQFMQYVADASGTGVSIAFDSDFGIYDCYTSNGTTLYRMYFGTMTYKDVEVVKNGNRYEIVNGGTSEYPTNYAGMFNLDTTDYFDDAGFHP